MSKGETIEDLYTPNSIRTFTGKYVNVFDPHPATICVEDIAHALAQIPRFGGHLPVFYSVAQHSMLVANMLPEELKLAGLMHESAEGLGLMDLPSPIKKKIHGYCQVEDNMMSVVAQVFGFEYPLHQLVKAADRFMLEKEWNYLMLNREYLDKIVPIVCLFYPDISGLVSLYLVRILPGM